MDESYSRKEKLERVKGTQEKLLQRKFNELLLSSHHFSAEWTVQN